MYRHCEEERRGNLTTIASSERFKIASCLAMTIFLYGLSMPEPRLLSIAKSVRIDLYISFRYSR